MDRSEGERADGAAGPGATARAEAPIRALIFDMDGTLVDSEPFAERAWTDFLRRHGHELRPEVLNRMIGLRLPDGVAIIKEAYALDPPLAEIAATYDELRLAALRGNLRPMPGAAELVAFGRESGLRLGLATSSLRHHADLTLAEIALAGAFDAEATGDEVERGKPAPDIFLLAAARLGVAPAHCVVLEDAPAGVAAAVAANMRCLWVPNAKTRDLPVPAAPAATLADLGAAIPWLQARGVEASRRAGGDGVGAHGVRPRRGLGDPGRALVVAAHQGGGMAMTVRVYLAAARLAPGPPEPGDLPAERVFLHASEAPEVWVETESATVPDPGRVVAFALARPMDLGFERVTGTVERTVAKRAPRRG